MKVSQVGREPIDIVKFAEEWLDVKPTKHQKKWLRLMVKNPFIIILGPRGHGKSTIMYIFLVWLICMDPTIRILIAGHKEELANTFARMVQMTLEREDLQIRFGLEPAKPWRVDYFFFKDRRHPVVQTVAKQAGMTGGRYDVIVFDDLLTVENQGTESRRKKIETWINSEVIPAIDPTKKRRIVILGTRKHLEDWYAKIIQIPTYHVVVEKLYEMVDGKKVFLWPERYNEDEERWLRAQMEPDEFAREFMNSPIAQEGLRFKREWLKFHGGGTGIELPSNRFIRYYMGIDPSMGKKGDRTSYFTICVVAFDWRPDKQQIYVVDWVRSKPDLGEQMEIIKAKVRQWNPRAVTIEYGLANRMFVDNVLAELPFLTTHNPREALQGTTETAKITRIEQVAGYLFRHGYIHLQDPSIHPLTKEFIDYEYVQFPEGSMDMLDALCMAVNTLRVGRGAQGSPVRLY